MSDQSRRNIQNIPAARRMAVGDAEEFKFYLADV